MAKIKKERLENIKKESESASKDVNRDRRPWTAEEDAELLRMRSENIPFSVIAERLGRNSTTCQTRLLRKTIRNTHKEWSGENDVALKAAYKKRKAEVWTIVAKEMGFSGSWQVIEKKIFEHGLNSLK